MKGTQLFSFTGLDKVNLANGVTGTLPNSNLNAAVGATPSTLPIRGVTGTIDATAVGVNNVSAIQFAVSSGGFGNIGMGGPASASDSYPVLIQRSNASAGTNIQVSNPHTDPNSAAKLQVSADNGNVLGEVAAFTSSSTVDAYVSAMTVRPNNAAAKLSLIAGDGASCYVSAYTGGDYTSAGEAIRVSADKCIQFMQMIAKPPSPPAGSLKLYLKSDKKLYVVDSDGTETALW